MKQKILIKEQNSIIYEGRISDIPIKESAIIAKSIELFNDDDPCIIHQSYVIKEYVDIVLRLLHDHNPLDVNNHLDDLSFLSLQQPQFCTIYLEG
ncbi:hypothetical protein [Candidatus Xianfuyuplasma coldseepsis]|uniref:Uncharacterized protein n=1 Tax=Candidatus Xianfuyuplasma coldseepsis TaxID=2782163 RepID=A0A7L7KTA5_9MOLU|nr:hypothetical protein [Xianfuyuplasma coldseepsis]QMS85522.1 hypothetical protein G4Z02_07130 [Xianfuyuplasma coldseepsis]